MFGNKLPDLLFMAQEIRQKEVNMKSRKIGIFLLNTVRLILLVFYAMALTIVIGILQLGTFAVTKIIRKWKSRAGIRAEQQASGCPAVKPKKNKSTSCFPTV